MYRFEDSLPRIPVPTLQETAVHYLKSVHPLLSTTEYAETTRAVEEFVKAGGVGEKLQERLIARRDDPQHRSWLHDWWTDAAYLTYREPIIPYVSYFYSHRDDRKRRKPAKRAAAITTAALEFKKQIDTRTLEPEYMKKLPMAMDSYQWMFNASRRPAKPADYPVKFPADENKYILVIRKNQFFKLQYEIDGRQLNTSELRQQFDRIYEKAKSAPPIGILTTENRDLWTDAREILLKAHPSNAEALAGIEAASFVVCLDAAGPVTLTERAKHYLYGNGQNRWFDKPAQFIIDDNGTAGFNGEHSMMDGTSTHRLNDYVCDVIFNEKLDFSSQPISLNLPEISVIEFRIDKSTRERIDLAQKHFDDLLGKHDLTVQAYQGYGKGLIKKFKFSPDAYVQLIIQLAYHKMFGKSQPTYESVMTRRFQQGRTEVCRSVSDDSVAFCKAISDHSSNPTNNIELFRNAVESHVQYLHAAADGKGADRHLFGLKKLMKADEEIPAIFRDPAYTYSSTWVLSTSQLSSEYLNGFGWSQVVDHGFGIAYMINESR